MASLLATRTQVSALDSRLQVLSSLVAENEDGLADATRRANNASQLTVEVEQVGDYYIRDMSCDLYLKMDPPPRVLKTWRTSLPSTELSLQGS